MVFFKIAQRVMCLTAPVATDPIHFMPDNRSGVLHTPAVATDKDRDSANMGRGVCQERGLTQKVISERKNLDQDEGYIIVATARIGEINQHVGRFIQG